MYVDGWFSLDVVNISGILSKTPASTINNGTFLSNDTNSHWLGNALSLSNNRIAVFLEQKKFKSQQTQEALFNY